ncbi:MAG: CBASS oligonucleotide cyclase [Pirellulales bacterium]
MARTITQGFEQLRQNLEITDLQSETVSTRQQSVRAALDDGLTVLETFLTGSYRRSTMIAPLKEADVDIVAVMDSSYYQWDGQASLLDKVKRVLLKRYPTTPKISRDGQAVTITFTDFCVDVVPAFNRKGGGYLIPDSIQKRWIETDPKRHVEIWAEANKKHGYKLVPIIKMMKAWNKMHSALLRSFSLETLTLQTLDGVTISDYPSGVRYVFDKARTRIQSGVFDPAGYGGNVASYLDTYEKINQVVTRLESACQRAVDAEALNGRGRPDLAFDKWRMIFGDYFPAHG